MEEPEHKAEQQEEIPTSVECPAAKDPAVRLFIGAAMGIAMGLWCLTDLREVPKDWGLKNINAIAGFLLNNVGPFFFFPAGVVCAVWGLVFICRKLVADDEGIGYVGRDKLAWSDVKALDTSKFEKKGILRLKYDKKGKERRLTLDGWKLQNFKPLVRLVESKVKTD